MRTPLVVILLSLLFSGMGSCASSTNKPTGKQDTVAAPPPRPRDAPPGPSEFQQFLMSLISTRNMVPDTVWRRGLDDSEMQFLNARLYKDDDDPDTEGYDFPFNDLQMTYHIIHIGVDDGKNCEWGSQFTINYRKLPIDRNCDRNNPVVCANTIRRYFYRHMHIMTMWGGPHDYNGYGDRIQYNYFFELSGKQPVQDIYSSIDGRVYHPDLYGDLNDDTLLDRLVFNGIMYPYCDDTCSITISAQTYKNRKWQPLSDNKGKPYFIKVHTDGDMETAKVLTSHWMRPL